MHFKSLSLGGRQPFGNRETLALAPITLIFGPNSAGKSRFLKTLRELKEDQSGFAPTTPLHKSTTIDETRTTFYTSLSRWPFSDWQSDKLESTDLIMDRAVTCSDISFDTKKRNKKYQKNNNVEIIWKGSRKYPHEIEFRIMPSNSKLYVLRFVRSSVSIKINMLDAESKKLLSLEEKIGTHAFYGHLGGSYSRCMGRITELLYHEGIVANQEITDRLAMLKNDNLEINTTLEFANTWELIPEDISRQFLKDIGITRIPKKYQKDLHQSAKLRFFIDDSGVFRLIKNKKQSRFQINLSESLSKIHETFLNALKPVTFMHGIRSVPAYEVVGHPGWDKKDTIPLSADDTTDVWQLIGNICQRSDAGDAPFMPARAERLSYEKMKKKKSEILEIIHWTNAYLQHLGINSHIDVSSQKRNKYEEDMFDIGGDLYQLQQFLPDEVNDVIEKYSSMIIPSFSIWHGEYASSSSCISWLRKKSLDSIKLYPKMKGIYLSYAQANIDWTQGKEDYISLAAKSVGLGVSQVLPIVLNAAIAIYNKKVKKNYAMSFIIEQPELHLHPKAHAALAEVIVHSALSSGTQWVIETHSENMILRIKNMIKRKIITKEQVAVNYMWQEKGKSFIKTIELDEKGNFVSTWPHGFFSDSYDDMLS